MKFIPSSFSSKLLASAVLATLLATACSKMPASNDSASGTDNNGNTQASQYASSSSGTDAAPAPFANRSKSSSEAASSESSKSSGSEPAKDTATRVSTIPSGTPITVRLQSAVSSASSSTGDRFEAVLAQPIEVNGRTLVPAGASATGRVVAVNRSGRLEHPGMIEIALTSLEVGGKPVAINTSVVAAKGSSHKKRNLAMIGGGAGGGALLGGLLGGGKGALIGSAVGAGAGTGTAYATGKKDVGFGVERHLTFRLREAVTVK